MSKAYLSAYYPGGRDTAQSAWPTFEGFETPELSVETLHVAVHGVLTDDSLVGSPKLRSSERDKAA